MNAKHAVLLQQYACPSRQVGLRVLPGKAASLHCAIFVSGEVIFVRGVCLLQLA